MGEVVQGGGAIGGGAIGGEAADDALADKEYRFHREFPFVFLQKIKLGETSTFC